MFSCLLSSPSYNLFSTQQPGFLIRGSDHVPIPSFHSEEKPQSLPWGLYAQYAPPSPNLVPCPQPFFKHSGLCDLHDVLFTCEYTPHLGWCPSSSFCLDPSSLGYPRDPLIPLSTTFSTEAYSGHTKCHGALHLPLRPSTSSTLPSPRSISFAPSPSHLILCNFLLKFCWLHVSASLEHKHPEDRKLFCSLVCPKCLEALCSVCNTTGAQ